MKIEVLDGREADCFLEKNHYLGKGQSGSIYLGIFEDELEGIASFARSKQQEKMFNLGLVLELNRFVLLNNEKNRASRYLAAVLKLVSADAVVSFADETAGHLGIIYQACNAYYLGKSGGAAGIEIDGKIYSGRNLGYSLLKFVGKTVKIVSLKGKHKYIFVTVKEKEKKEELVAYFKKLSKSYPKANLFK